jgi:hypothetical protein
MDLEMILTIDSCESVEGREREGNNIKTIAIHGLVWVSFTVIFP